MFVQEGIYDEVEKKLVEKAKALVIGDPFDPKAQHGPQARTTYSSTIMLYIDSKIYMVFVLL